MHCVSRLIRCPCLFNTCSEGAMDSQIPEGLSYSDVKYLPIVKHFAKKINLVDTLDTMVSSQMDLSPGIAVLATVLDTLSGRTPLYRLEEFFFEKDIELLLGTDVEAYRFSDYNLARVLDKIYQTGTPMRLEAGCFVLLCNIGIDDDQWTAKELLRLYKNQSGIEQNFGFLKDPLIVNSIFLKKPHRIEVLGLVLVISLLIWRLVECSMRQYIESTGKAITGWRKRPTKRETSFMLTTERKDTMPCERL